MMMLLTNLVFIIKCIIVHAIPAFVSRGASGVRVQGEVPILARESVVKVFPSSRSMSSSSSSFVNGFLQRRRPFGPIVISNGRRRRCHDIVAATRLARNLPVVVPLATRQSRPTIICTARMAFSTNNSSSSNNNNNNSSSSISNDDLDSLCNKQHITDINNISIEEFAQGCKFLHQIALGNIGEVQAIVKQRPNIVNFRDYDRRSKF
jgi:hypothetical protein